jgi:hypothetical protein
MSEIEEWRSVAGYEGYYEVSSLGSVKSLARVVTYRRNDGTARTKTIREIILTGQLTWCGYRSVLLSRHNKATPRTVHSLVCEAFHGPRPGGFWVAHNDGDPSNNRASNLRWATPTENSADTTAHGRRRVGVEHKLHVLSEAEAMAIRDAPKYWGCVAALAERYGVSTQTVKLIRSRKAWKHLG